MASRALMTVLTVLALAAAGCGDDEETTSGGASGATGASSANDAAAQANARNAQVAIETYATDNAGSYAGASPEELAQIEPSLNAGDLEVVSTDSSYTVSALAPSGATYSVDGGGGPADYTCEPPGTGDCPDSGDWN